MVAFVVVPGIDGSDERHWQTLWEHGWGELAVRIAPESWSEPVLSDWVRAVGEGVDAASLRDPDVVLLAHSLGCWAAALWMNQNAHSGVVGALLVAPPDPEGSAFPREAAATFIDVNARPIGYPGLVVASVDDPYCSADVARQIASRWGAGCHVVGEFGHLNSASGVGHWPAGQNLLTALTESALANRA